MVNRRGKDVGKGRNSSKGNKITSVAFGRSADASSSAPCNAKNKNKKPDDVSGGSEKTTSVSTDASTVFKHTVASLAKKATVGKKIIKETRNVKIGRQTNLPADEIEAQIEPTESKKVSASVQGFRSPRGCKTSTRTTATKIIKQESFAGEKKSSRKKDVHKSSTSQQDMEPEAEPKNYIQFKGFDKSKRKIGVCCSLCERDLGEEPVGHCKIGCSPIVAILPCGHVYHSKCLNFDDLEAKQDPPCVFCASLNS